MASLFAGSTNMECSVSILRSVNVLFALGNALLIIALRTKTSVCCARLMMSSSFISSVISMPLQPSDPHSLLHAAMIIAFPINFFFAFIFYTDSGAVFFVLLMYYLAERVNLLAYPSARGSYVFSALVSSHISVLQQVNKALMIDLCMKQSGAAAVIFRQTNIVWVLFVAGTVVVRCVELAHGTFIYGYAVSCGLNPKMFTDAGWIS